MSNTPSVGTMFGRYALTRELGRGGFATVFAARDTQSGQEVALKVLHPDAANGYEHTTVERFRREVEIVAGLGGRYTVRLLDAGESPALWAAFELLPGRNLSDVLKEHGTLSAGATAHILRQVLASLHEAHGRGLLHRDLKPDNIRVFDGDEGELTVKLFDFGLARAAVVGSASVTRTGELLGTPRYMSPEQLSERPLTPASDIYSLGLIGFELLYGADALKGNTLLDQVARLHDPEMFTQTGDSPEQAHLTAVLRRMVVPNVEQRLGSAQAVRAAMQAPAAPAVPTPAQPVPAPTQPVSKSRVASRVGMIGLGLVVVVIVVALARIYMLREDAPEETPRLAAPAERVTGVALTQSRDEDNRPKPEPVPEPEPAPYPCDGHDGPWDKDDLYVYIPEGADLDAAPFVFVAVPDHWYTTEHLGRALDYLKLREHADARGFPVVLSSIEWNRLTAPERLSSTGLETLTPKVRRFYRECELDAPAVLFAESGPTKHALKLVAEPPVFFNAAVMSGIRDRKWDITPTNPQVPLLIFAQTDNKHAPYSGRAVVGTGDDIRVIEGGPAEVLHDDIRTMLDCSGKSFVEPHPSCERQQCDHLFELCIVRGGQWWSDVRPPNMDDARWAAGGSVSGFPYHAVMWDFLDAALKPAQANE